jgi:hypothetical protein
MNETLEEKIVSFNDLFDKIKETNRKIETLKAQIKINQDLLIELEETNRKKIVEMWAEIAKTPIKQDI